MGKKRSVFLFGAGAPLLWESPTTSELTALVRKSGFKTCSNEIYITEFIYKTLISNGFKPADVNFETIINVIEELLVYYSQFDSIKKVPSILHGFFDPKFEEDLFNYSVRGGEPKHNYQLQIPRGKEYHFSNFSQHDETPHQFFLQHLIAELLTTINERISKYTYHTPGNSVINTELYESKLFVKWMEALASESVLRLYTLNYDRVFKILLEHNGISVFEGFNCGEFVDYSAMLRANVTKILSDFNCNVHYNLHGSAFWQAEFLDKDLLPNPEFLLTCAPCFPINDEHPIIQIEKGKTIMLTNIVTGYQKAQKTLITPFKQMHAAFDKDCCFADDIYIIGYSLGDEHINESIKTAIRYNPKVKITIIDPFFLKTNLDFQMAIKLFPFKQEGNMKPTTIVKNELHSFFDGAFMLHTIDFKTFLERKVSNNKIFV